MNFAIFIIATFSYSGSTIITRHDKNDLEYQHLSKQFEKSICHLNLGKNVPDGEGTIIHPNWILTAAHCAIDIKKKLDKGEQHFVTIMNDQLKVSKVLIHENWAENEAYDIALIQLAGFSKHAKPVNFYTGNDEMDKLIFIVGQGDNGNGIDGIRGNDRKLRAATNKVDEATEFWLKWDFDNPAVSPGKVTEWEGISGPGDSGGPAFLMINDKIYVVGISSAQSTRNSNGKEGVYGVREYYTRVSKYVEWIRKNLD